jgi:serine/threonine-protein phosphatase 4 regulatory subunit 1
MRIQSCDLIGEEDEILASEDPSKDPVFAITSEGVRALRRSDTALGAPGDIGPRLPGSGSGSSGSTSWNSSEGSSAGAASLNSRKESISSSTDMTTGTPASSIETPGSVVTADTSQSVHAAAQRDKEMSKDLFQGTEEQPDLDAGPLLDRPIIPVHIFTPLIGSLLLSQNSLVADPARAAVVAVLGKLRKADIPILDEWPDERPEGVKLAYTAQSGSHSHDIPMFSVISRRMVQKELLEGIVIGIGRLHEDRAQSRKGSDGSSIIGAAPDQGDQTDSGLQRTVSRASGQPGTVSSDGADSEAAFLKQQLAQEAVLGRAISMNLIASISEFLQEHEIARYDLVTEVARTLEDEPGVKAEAALALAYLAKQAPQDHIEVMVS